MSTFTETKTPDHVLIRWDDKTGALKGGHIAWTEKVLKDGELLSQKTSDPQPIALAGGAGFPLADVLDTLHADALSLIEAKDAQIGSLTQAATDAAAAHASEIADAHGARDAALSQAQALQAQLDELRPPEVNGVPQEVTMRQAQLVLLGAHLLDAVEAAIAAIPGDAGKAARITWTKSSMVKRTDPLIVQLVQPAGPLGLTDAQIDGLFVQAAKL